jgi:hypothetical protein
MASMIDPAADFLWESVSTTVTKGKVVEKQPRTNEEWAEVRRQAIILAEGANLLMMDGRHVVKEGANARRSRHAGNLTAAESEEAIGKNRDSFLAFAKALRDVGRRCSPRRMQRILKASSTRAIRWTRCAKAAI